MKKYLVELIGTFFLILTIILAVNGTAGLMAPLAIGLVLIVLVYAGGHISGAHYNPAVTFALWLRGNCPTKEVPGYVISQIIGAVMASLLGRYLLSHFPGAVGIEEMEALKFIPAAFAEFLGTFLLCFVIFNVAFSQNTEGNSYYGIAIGLTLAGCVYVFGEISGGFYNPAVALGISMSGMSAWSNMLVYLFSQFIAAAAATAIFGFVNGPDKPK
jgi:aquaporin Z